MIEIVINFDEAKNEYKVYEPTTDTLLVSKNLTEALVNLNLFLHSKGMIQKDILEQVDISYHIDSFTMKSIIESNVNLLKQLKAGPSGFMLSSRKFGGSKPLPPGDFKSSANNFSQKKTSNFSKNTGFSKSSKKFNN